MQQIEPLHYGKFYHIYNRGTDSCDLFVEKSNYEYFLCLYDKYISSVADTYAWVLMKNHFHLLVKIKEVEEIGGLKALSGWKTTERAESAPPVILAPSAVPNHDGGYKFHRTIPSHQFSHLFNAYAQAFNKRNNRTGSLFEHPFKRKLIEDIDYFKTMVLYIHNNPVHHRIKKHAMDYPWSSYLTCISVKPKHLQRDVVIGWFDNQSDFKTAHNNPGDIIDLEKWLGLS